MHPSNELRRQGTYSIDNPIALAQLAAWQDLADSWSVRVTRRGEPGKRQLHLICTACQCTVFVLVGKDGRGYTFALAQVTSALVAHLRNIHRDRDPAEGIRTDGKQDTETNPDA